MDQPGLPTGASGLRVLVTAGAGGIGLAIVRAFVAAGAHVHVADVDAAGLASLSAGGLPVSVSRCDVADRADVAAMMASAVGALGGLDVLVNNAGVAGPTGRFDQIPPEEWDRTLAVNITGQFNVARLAVPELIKGRRSSIVCMASAAGRMAFPNRSAYAASKWAVIGFMRTIAAELGASGVRANAILPGMVDGPRLQAVIAAKAASAGSDHEAVVARGLAGVSIKSLVQPDEVAALAVFLASDAGRSISGQSIGVDNDLHVMA